MPRAFLCNRAVLANRARRRGHRRSIDERGRGARSRPRARRGAVRHGAPPRRSPGDRVGRRCGRDAVGAQTRCLGGLGAFESISVRGQAPGRPQVLIDGVPLARHRAGHDRPRAVPARRVRRGRSLSRRGADRARRRGRRRRAQHGHAARARRARRAHPRVGRRSARSARATSGCTTATITAAVKSSTTIG